MKVFFIPFKRKTLAQILLISFTIMLLLILNSTEAVSVLNPARYQAIYKGSDKNPIIAFECNVVWGTEHVGPMLDIFKEHDIRITFFIGGEWAKDNPDLLKRIVPCTGNTLAKLANAITDTPVLMAAKAHLRNQRPLLLGIATNDGLGNNAKNIGVIINTKNIFMVPFWQDDPIKKPNSLVADLDRLLDASLMALRKEQIQPVIIERKRL